MSDELDRVQTTEVKIEPNALDVLVPEQFAVVDAKSANWIVRRIVEIRAYAQAVDEWAEAEKRHCAEVEAFFFDRFGAELENFTRASIVEQNKRFKHKARNFVKLPAGLIGFRAQPTRVRVVDEQTAIQWCRRHLPAAIRITERVSRTTINEHYGATGQMPEGTALDAECRRLYVK